MLVTTRRTQTNDWERFLLDGKTGRMGVGQDREAGIVPFHQSAFYEPFDLFFVQW